MQVIEILEPSEYVGLDHDLISGMFSKMPEIEAHDMVFRTIEKIVRSMLSAEQSYYK